MKTALSPSPTASVPTTSGGGSVKRAGLVAALAALLAMVWMPTPQGSPLAGQVMLATLAFAAIVWMSEALNHAVSSVVIAALMVFLLGYAPDAARPSGVYVGTGAAIGLALSGFSSSAVALVAAAGFALTYWPWMGHMNKAM